MASNKIDVRMLSKMFLAGAQNLEAKKEWINELNVFPVPDGDTGTNMSMTIMAAAKEVSGLIDDDMEWYCPNCGNRDHDKLNVARRTCGYIGTNFWNKGRTQEIKERVLHIDNKEAK